MLGRPEGPKSRGFAIVRNAFHLHSIWSIDNVKLLTIAVLKCSLNIWSWANTSCDVTESYQINLGLFSRPRIDAKNRIWLYKTTHFSWGNWFLNDQTILPAHCKLNRPRNDPSAGFKGLFSVWFPPSGLRVLLWALMSVCELLTDRKEKEVFSSSGREGS